MQPVRPPRGRRVTVYHGTSCKRGMEILKTGQFALESDAPWNWLGDGVYFWEENPDRALLWAKDRFGAQGMVLRTTIRLGACLDLHQGRNLSLLAEGYGELKAQYKAKRPPRRLPKNLGEDHDLDCAVINHVCKRMDYFDTVRCSFQDGPEVYPTSAFHTLTHTQIAVRTLACIVGPTKYEMMEMPWR